MNYINTL